MSELNVKELNIKESRLLLRPTEAFKITGVSSTLGWKLINSGQWPIIKLDKAVRIPLEGLRKWVESKTFNRSA